MRTPVFVLLVAAAGPAAAATVLHDTDVVIHDTLVRGAEATAWVAVSAAASLDAAQPVPGATVTLTLTSRPATNGQPPTTLPLAQGITDAAGRAPLRFRVPDVEPGTYELAVRTRSEHGEDMVRRTVQVTQPLILHLRTDRPVYRAGQAVRWRVTLLGGADAHPRAKATVDVQVRDPRSTAIWRGQVVTDETGMTSGELPLGDDLIFGAYTVTARAFSEEAAAHIEVRDFVLPPFTVRIETEGPTPAEPGAPIRARVVAAYPYGEPVAGKVSFKAGDAVGAGTLDREGRFRFDARAPDAGALRLEASVTDGAGRTRRASLDVSSRADDLRVAIVPDRPILVAGQTHTLTILTTDGAGGFVPARLFLRFSGKRGRSERSSDGALRLAIPVRADAGVLKVEVGAVTADGRLTQQDLTLRVERAGRVVRVPEPLVPAGQAVAVEGLWPKARGPLLAVLLRRGAPVATAPASVDATGRLEATLPVPEGIFGLATVRVIEAAWDHESGRDEVSVEGTSVYLLPARLAVAIQGATRHRPGEEARLEVTVRDAAGRPAAGVGLAASVVDERVLALGRRLPDLVEVLGALDVSRAEAAGLTFAALLVRPEPRARLALEALIASLPVDGEEPFVLLEAALRFRKEAERLAEARADTYPFLLREPELARRTSAGWEFRPALADVLVRAGWKAPDRLTPWGNAIDWPYASRLQRDFVFAVVAESVVEERLERLYGRLRALGEPARRRLLAREGDALRDLWRAGLVERWMIVDAWNHPFRVVVSGAGGRATIDLVSAGADEVLGNHDDHRRDDVFSLVSIGDTTAYGGALGSGRGYGTAGGGFGLGRLGAGPRELEVAVRRRFDETVLWATGLRTDAAGRAALEVPLADSITGWEVAVEAVSAGGATGTATTRLETFLPVHVDVETPHRLTVGDELELPVVVANHTDRSRRFAVVARLTGALASGGAGTVSLEVPAGAVRAAVVPVRAVRPGSGEVELRLTSAGLPLDAIRRSIPVDAAGALVRTAQAIDDAKRIAFTVPADAASGTVVGRLRIFRGVGDQAQDGLEDLLQEPHGCFEQTSSTTYPNLLVLDLLRDQPGAEAARRTARAFVARGYQRLVSYEVEGGGFSWFGEAPANQVLTAYGLLEFVDMARVYPVDDELIARTRRWLLARQQADGSWRADGAWLHDWSAVQGRVSTTAFIAWALAESGYRGPRLDRAFGFLGGHAAEVGRNPYLLALWAAGATAARRSAKEPLRRLAAWEQRGARSTSFGAGGMTLFYASGRAADVQVTALAAMALARSGEGDRAARALAWLWGARTTDGWGGTQGTVLALRAAALGSPPRAPRGAVTVALDGRPAGTFDLAAPRIPTVELPGTLAAGPHELTLSGDAADLAADLRLGWRQAGPPRRVVAGLEVDLSAPSAPVRLGAPTPMKVTLRNPGKTVVPMPMVIVPVPPGFRPDPSSLAELERRKRVSRVEDQGSELRFYLAGLAPGHKVELPFAWEPVAVARVTQGPAQAYAYYDPSIRGASAAFTLISRRP